MTKAQHYLFSMVSEANFQDEHGPPRVWASEEEEQRARQERRELEERLFKSFLPEYAALCHKYGVIIDNISWGGELALCVVDSPSEVDRHIKELESNCDHERRNDHGDACLDCGAVFVDANWQ